MYRECIGGPLDGSTVTDYGPGEIHMTIGEVEVPIGVQSEFGSDDRYVQGVRSVRYWGCANGHYHHDPE